MCVILRAKNISKQYRLGQVGTGTISHDINRYFAKLRGKEDPYIKIGESNDRTIEGGEYVWAIRNINFEVNEGEVLGIIGKNGAGKSTLLKLLSRVTSPTEGEIFYNGRIASLLEVGTGFHPELTGKENIFLNGAILGMKKIEIESKLNEIIQFSGCAKYVDTPVKRYSSGMKVRLGFAVAAFLEPEILVVDEVLAVGDAEFQKKCIEKMKYVSDSGRTILFVSHNMASIRNLCTRVVVLNNGESVFDGEVDEGINQYIKLCSYSENSNFKNSWVRNERAVGFLEAEIISNFGVVEFSDEYYELRISFYVNEIISDLVFGLILEDSTGNILFVSTTDDYIDNILKRIKDSRDYKLSIKLPSKILKPGDYLITLSLRKTEGPIHKVEKALRFKVEDNSTYRGIKGAYRKVPIIAPEIEMKLM